MGQDDLIEILRQRPFRPFRIHRSDGVFYEVRHPELVLVGQSSAVVFFPAPNRPPPAFERYDIISLLHITRLEPIELPAQPASS